MRKYAAFLISLSFGMSACNKTNPNLQEAAARIGTVEITEQDIQNSLNLLSEQDRKFASTPIGKQNLLQILTREKLILQDATNQGIAQDKDYQQALANKRAELDAIYDQFASDALIQAWYTSQAKVLEPSEKEVKEYYDKYPYEMTIKQILVDNAQTADQLLRTLKSSPRRWNEISRQHSIAPASLQVLTFMPGEYLDSLEVIAANSPIGKVQGFFKTPQGFHIIMKTNEKRLSFKEAEPRIKQVLQDRKLDQLLDALKVKYEVIIYDKNE